MVRHAEQPGHAGTDLDQTAKLRALDVGAYEVGLGPDDRSAELPAAELSDAADDASELQPLAALPETETLLDIEAWVAAQDARARDALAIRIATVMENAQANEWKRNAWHSTWQALESDLTEAREELRRVEAERAALAAVLTKANAELSERDAAIAHLKAADTAQVTALAELAATRSHEQGDYTRGMQELRVHAETLAAQIKALEQRQRRSAESPAAREAEPANLSRALQARTEIAQRASDLIAARDGELAEGRARAGALEAELQAATRQLAEQAALEQSREAALNAAVAQLAASQDRVANLERETTGQSERLAAALAQLAHAKTLVEQAEASRRPLESELARMHTELERETRRANALDAAQRNLALELERTRGALDERDSQLRRLGRYATASAQVSGRIKVGSGRQESNALSETRGLPEHGVTLVPLGDDDDEEAPALRLGRYTTIGRAPESDLCLKDSSISRRHAVLAVGPSGAFIEDLRSANGVLVNQQRIRHARLADGDVIELGAKRFRFTVPAAGPAGAGT